DDFVFYNQPRHASSAVLHTGKRSGPVCTDSLSIDLGATEPGIEKIVVSASAYGGNFGQLSLLAVAVTDARDDTELLQFTIPDATVETAMICAEFYRRNGAWKFRAVGQGYSSGLRGVATDCGITVEDDDLVQDPAPAQAPTVAASTPQSVAATHGPPAGYQPTQVPSYPPAGYQQTPVPSYPQYPPAAGQPLPQPPVPAESPEGPEDDVVLQPFPTDNPYLKRVFKMKEFGRAPGRALEVYRERVADPEEKMIAAFKSKHGQYRWGYVVLTSHALRWFQTLPTRDEDFWSWNDVSLSGSVVICEGFQYQLKGFGAGRKFKALMLVLAQSEGWEKDRNR
ncbi:MAG: TerD family protein, partial [Mycolicibacterium sp.]